MDANGEGCGLASPEDIRALLERILRSRHFAPAGRKKKFLSLVCEFYLTGRTDQLSEFVIGCEVFGRDDKFNPAEDPSVRVCAHEVRKKLAAYYQNEGAHEPVILEIPTGAYRPVFSLREQAPDVAQVHSTITEPRSRFQSRTVRITAICGMVAVLACSFAAFLRLGGGGRLQLRQTIWREFLTDQRPILVVLSNPPVFQFVFDSDPVHLQKQAIPVRTEQMIAASNKVGVNPNRLPFVSPSLDYTGVGEAISLAHVAKLLSLENRDFLIKQSRTASVEDLKSHDVILLGAPLSNEWVRGAGELDFDLSHNYVRNRKPRTGEQREYRVLVDESSGEPILDWALVSVVPNFSPAHPVMMLAGIRGEGCQAAAEFMTSTNYMEGLQRELSSLSPSHRGPRYFQALLRVEIKNRVPTRITLAALHEIL